MPAENLLQLSSSVPRVLVLLGPTASGKTLLGVHLALRLNAEIISADSRQVYREMTIGTAKPDTELLARVPHHFIDTLDVGEDFDAGSFADAARIRLAEISGRGSPAIVVGGSTLYLRALIHGFDDLPKGDDGIRQRLIDELETFGATALHQRLQSLDPEQAAKFDASKTQRLIRSLEVIELTGEKISILQKGNSTKPQIDFVIFGLELPRGVLYERINRRVDEMMQHGFLEEARSLFDKHSSQMAERKINALETVGYAELFRYFRGDLSLDAAVEKIKQHTRNYAKRQLTFFRNQFSMYWLAAPQSETELILTVDGIVSIFSTTLSRSASPLE